MISGKRMFRTGMMSLAAIGLLAMSAPGTMAAMEGSISHHDENASGVDQQWTVLVGGATKDQAFQAMGFFPSVMTVDAGDTVHFAFTGVHTVSFPGKNGQLGARGNFAPAGGHSYDGSTYTSSGMGVPHQLYSLKFTKPGVYPYYCEMHAGMAGVIIVQSAGMKYPFTQEQYNKLATTETQTDLMAGKRAQMGIQNMMMGKPGPHGTTIWSVLTDVPEPLSYTLNLAKTGGSSVSGTATFSMEKPGTWKVALNLAGLQVGKTYTSALDLGASGSGVTVPGSSRFPSFQPSVNGTADVSSTVAANAIPTGTWFVDVMHNSGGAVASGMVNYPSYAYERFDMGTIHIHVGDTIVWTELGANEAHTVTFLPKGWKDIPNESMAPIPAGGHVYRGTGFFNSGYLFPGMSYELTFEKAGTFEYRCLLHDVIGMYGRVDVTPQKGH